ncbi:hypothetical protein BD310DRAFT_917193 [Dichomitus squalens]|uniref:Uncharacterized protein n=1 Tax=Dichomitus squalens TaxID=114155 RepID=A0A4Q9Q8D1_9APHY|nr:hypothetical protein BD310DRAFT_917193 [Dichomitus squalens]
MAGVQELQQNRQSNPNMSIERVCDSASPNHIQCLGACTGRPPCAKVDVRFCAPVAFVIS